jgi:hypothetical protein
MARPMTDETAKNPFSRPLVYFALAAFIAMIVMIAAPILGSNSTPTVGFTVTVKVAQGEVTSFGNAHLTDGRIGFEGSRLSFAGTIEGDQIKIEGKVALADQTTTRAFRASGRIVGDRLNLPVNSTDGRRIGSLRLEFPSD